MSIAYLDCFSGVAGDMILGAFIDAGMPLAYLKSELKKIKLGGYKLHLHKEDGSVGGTNLYVEVTNSKQSAAYLDVKKQIKSSGLSPCIKKISEDILSNLAGAEARVHRKKISNVHFHEVGYVDSVVDIVGAAIGAEYFNFDKIYSSPLPVTRGYVKCAHGRLPVPAPATMELLKGIPTESSPVKGEIVTPTGVAILRTLVHKFGSSPLRNVNKIGYGYGDTLIPGHLNALRLLIGEGYPLMVVEANIDDMNPEFYPHVVEEVLRAGAIDAGVIPMVMKKGRPGAFFHVLCEEKDRKKIIKRILQETTTFGVRYFPIEREIADREVKKVKTKYGTVRVKIAKYDGKTTTISPEHEDCRKIASKKRVSIKEVYHSAILALF